MLRLLQFAAFTRSRFPLRNSEPFDAGALQSSGNKCVAAFQCICWAALRCLVSTVIGPTADSHWHSFWGLQRLRLDSNSCALCAGECVAVLSTCHTRSQLSSTVTTFCESDCYYLAPSFATLGRRTLSSSRGTRVFTNNRLLLLAAFRRNKHAAQYTLIIHKWLTSFSWLVSNTVRVAVLQLHLLVPLFRPLS